MINLIVGPEAEQDAFEARDWYAEKGAALADAFSDELAHSFARLSSAPLLYTCVHADVRKCKLRTFPYAVYFIVEPDTIFVMAIVHARRNPRVWRQRASE